jgi:hypothetical protein
MALVVRGYKPELDLNNQQRTACLKHAGCARFAYNWGWLVLRKCTVQRVSVPMPSSCIGSPML